MQQPDNRTESQNQTHTRNARHSYFNADMDRRKQSQLLPIHTPRHGPLSASRVGASDARSVDSCARFVRCLYSYLVLCSHLCLLSISRPAFFSFFSVVSCLVLYNDFSHFFFFFK